MSKVRSILFECNCYRGGRSRERCRAVEDYIMERVGASCGLESATMREIDVGDGVVQATFELVYTKGNCGEIIHMVDRALLDAGIVAFKALVSVVASHAAEAIIAGAGTGALAGGAATSGGAKNGGRRTAFAVLAGALVGGLVGAAVEELVEDRVPYRIATKRSGRWHVRPIPRPR